MAFRSRGRRGGFKRRRRARTRWTGDQTTAIQNLAAATAAQFIMLTPTDYELNPLLEEGGGGRVERIVGQLALSSAGGNAGFAVAILAPDQAALFVQTAGTNDPSVFETIRNGDVMWMRVGVSKNRTVDGGYEVLDFDIRVRRRLEDTGVLFVIKNISAATSLDWHLGYRMLIANV